MCGWIGLAPVEFKHTKDAEKALSLNISLDSSILRMRWARSQRKDFVAKLVVNEEWFKANVKSNSCSNGGNRAKVQALRSIQGVNHLALFQARFRLGQCSQCGETYSREHANCQGELTEEARIFQSVLHFIFSSSSSRSSTSDSS